MNFFFEKAEKQGLLDWFESVFTHLYFKHRTLPHIIYSVIISRGVVQMYNSEKEGYFFRGPARRWHRNHCRITFSIFSINSKRILILL